MAEVSITHESVVDGIRAGVRQAKGIGLAPEDITDSTPLWSADELGQPCLALDSLDVLELIVFLEDEYDWDLPESSIDAHDCRTVGDLATLVIEHLRGKP